MYSNEDLAFEGHRLASKARELAGDCPVKSHTHEMFLYESAILAAHADALESRKSIPDHLKTSTFLATWGVSFFRSDLKEFKDRVESFYQRYSALESS